MVFNLALSIGVLLLYLLTHISQKDNKRNDMVFLVLTFILFFVLIGSREMTMGNDTQGYLWIYKVCDTYKWDVFDIGLRYEPGFLFFNVILSFLHISPRFFLCITALIFCAAMYKFIKDDSNNYLMSILLFINLLFFFQSMSIMRQFMALSIVITFGFRFVKEKKLFKFIAAIIIAGFFHYTALISLLLYPLYYFKYSRKRVIIIAICAVSAFLFLGRIYTSAVSMFSMEVDYSYMLGEAKLNNVISTLIFLAMYVFSVFVIKKEERQKYSFYLYIFLATAALYFVSMNMAIFSRVALYLAVFSIIALPNIIKENIKESRLFVNSIIVGLFVTYATIIIVTKPEWNSAYNYKTCLMPKQEYICEE